MRKVLFVTSNSRLYGAEKSLFDLVKILNKHEYVPVVLFPEEGPLVLEISKLGVKVIIENFVCVARRFFRPIKLMYFIRNLVLSVKMIVAVIKREDIDIVHSNTSACLASAIAAKVSKRPHVWHIREIVITPKIVRYFYRIAIPFLADRVIATSQAVKNNICPKGNNMRGKLNVLGHGVDIQRFEAGKDVLHQEYSIPYNTKLVGNVGILRPEKGQHVFIKMAKIVKNSYDNVKFIVAGDLFYDEGNIDKDLQDLCRTEGLEQDVFFTGYRNDIENIFASIDIFVHTSIAQEGYGRTILEAMASGKPVIAFDHGGPHELVTDGLNGFLVPPGEVDLMARRVIGLLNNDKLSREMGMAGKDIIRKTFSMDKYWQGIKTIYKEIESK